MKTPILMAAVLVAAAACGRDVSAPEGPTIVGIETSPTIGLFSVSATGTAEEDSVVAGYGSQACGGLEYQSFEYDPATQTEYVVCADTTVDPIDTTWIPYIRPAPTPAPAPAPAPAPTPVPCPADTTTWIGSCSDPIEYPDPPYDP